MNNDQRVLSRRGARELTPNENDHVRGGIRTLLTVCTTPNSGNTCDLDTLG